MTEDVPKGVQIARVFVCIGVKDWVGALPHETLLAEFELPESETTDLRKEIEARLAAGRPNGVVLRETRGYTSWGADSGEVIRLVLFFGASAGLSGVIGNALYDFLRHLARRSQASDLDGSSLATPLSRDEALERAKWSVVHHYGLDVDGLDLPPQSDNELNLLSEVEDKETGGWAFGFAHEAEIVYHVEIGFLADLPTVTKIGREVRRK